MNITTSHPANIFKHCPACGSTSFNFDGTKAFNCSSCGFKFYLNAATATAAILVDATGNILLTKRKFEPSAGYLDLPGGFVDLGERVEDCLKREIIEELGISINEITFLASFPNEYRFKNISYFTCDLAFVCPVDNFNHIKPNDDVADAVIVSPFEIDYSKISFKSIENILKLYVNSLTKK